MTAVFAFKKDLLTIKIPPTLSSGGRFVVFGHSHEISSRFIFLPPVP